MTSRHDSVLTFAAVQLIIFVVIAASYNLYVQNEQRQLQEPTGDDSHQSWMLRSDGHVRNCITGKTIGRVRQNFTTRAIAVPTSSKETEDLRRQSFQEVFDKRLWGTESDPNFKGPIASGHGSTLHYSQEMIVVLSRAVEQYKRQFGLRRVRLLDVPCGDLHWMSRFLMTRDDVDYTGVDIVPHLVANHKVTFAKYRSWRFVLADVVNNGTEIFGAAGDEFDIVLSRFMMIHLFNADVVKILAHLSALGSRQGTSGRPVYLFTTTLSGTAINKELRKRPRGRFRNLNLEIPPISLPPPLCVARDGPPGSVTVIGLWMLPVSQVVDCKTPLTVNAVGFPFEFYACVDWSI